MSSFSPKTMNGVDLRGAAEMSVQRCFSFGALEASAAVAEAGVSAARRTGPGLSIAAHSFRRRAVAPDAFIDFGEIGDNDRAFSAEVAWQRVVIPSLALQACLSKLEFAWIRFSPLT